ncbi:MBL fold metallo-hydrolase [Hydrogenophaga sp.]|uniref:MBL fold metallo-hydrolase n=1 Tax=Hydrogenophaga sp. TaxID=1904254 RepID=UPI002607A60F|nr:MBL fold metallo-hydrolase [Hydrogenophaga sp.]
MPATTSLGFSPIGRNQMTPPSPDQIEVTLIGPNVGECVILHYAEEWIIVDSCISRGTKMPAAISYLQSIGIDPQKIKIVACSHWHDDHIRGIGDILQFAPNAKFWMSNALAAKEFLTLISAYREWPKDGSEFTSGLEELAKCLDIVKSRGQAPHFANHDQRLLLWPNSSAELWALSPSAETTRVSLVNMSSMLPVNWAKKTALPSGPNHVAVAMHFRAGAHSILLGSDLEEHGNTQTGWNAVLSSQGRPNSIASLYKVAHHGSQTGEHPGIWSQLLTSTPISILTPFTRSDLPRHDDVTRITTNSSSTYISSMGKATVGKRSGALAKAVKQKKLASLELHAGAVQCRINAADATANWSVTLLGGAGRL